MNSTKYIGMDVHTATVSVAVLDFSGKLIMESILETKANTILQFIRGLSGDLQLTFEEGTWAAWLHDLLRPYVTKLMVCNPRKSALLKDGDKGDKIDARKLAELLRGGYLKPVYHQDHGLRMLRELSRSYLALSQDLTRVMNRIKALYRGLAIPCGGTQVYALCHREVWLSKIPDAGVRAAPSTSTNNWMPCSLCAKKCDRSYWPKAGSIVPQNYCVRFLRSARFGQLSW